MSEKTSIKVNAVGARLAVLFLVGVGCSSAGSEAPWVNVDVVLTSTDGVLDERFDGAIGQYLTNLDDDEGSCQAADILYWQGGESDASSWMDAQVAMLHDEDVEVADDVETLSGYINRHTEDRVNFHASGGRSSASLVADGVVVRLEPREWCTTTSADDQASCASGVVIEYSVTVAADQAGVGSPTAWGWGLSWDEYRRTTDQIGVGAPTSDVMDLPDPDGAYRDGSGAVLCVGEHFIR